MERWTFLNDEFLPDRKAKLGLNDLALQRGYAVFDFLKCVDRIPVFVDDHLERFYSSAATLRLAVPYQIGELKQIVQQLMEKNSVEQPGIRIQLTGGYSTDGYSIAQPNLIISQQDFKPVSEKAFSSGIKLMTAQYQRQLPQVKTTDYLMAIWLQQQAREMNADDILYCNNLSVLECPRANIFIVTKNDELISPAENILAGITRKQVLTVAKKYYRVAERGLSLTELRNAKEVFITSTTKAILPVYAVDDIHFAPPGKITTHLRQLLATVTEQYLTANK